MNSSKDEALITLSSGCIRHHGYHPLRRVLSVLLPQNLMVRDPITYRIEKGWIIDVRGGLEAEIVKCDMASFNDKRGFGMSHVGWGMNPKAKWHNFLPSEFTGGMGMEPVGLQIQSLLALGTHQAMAILTVRVGPGSTETCSATVFRRERPVAELWYVSRNPTRPR